MILAYKNDTYKIVWMYDGNVENVGEVYKQRDDCTVTELSITFTDIKNKEETVKENVSDLENTEFVEFYVPSETGEGDIEIKTQ